MPWVNNITKNGLIWLGSSIKLYQDPVEVSASWGIEVDFSLYKYGIDSFRYYKKLDWLLGIIGGAMLLFYIILWVPCNYINRNLHKINNVPQLLVFNVAPEG